MAELKLPIPRYDGPHQTGIADPAWPGTPPSSLSPADRERYAISYAGQIERQRHLQLVFADVTASSIGALASTLRALSGFAVHQMAKAPVVVRPLDAAPKTRRVSITIAFGATLFVDAYGDDRFGLAGRRPRGLKIMPQFAGDKDFSPRDLATDLAILIASDDYYVNEYIVGRLLYGAIGNLVVRRVERGYARPDSREPSGFEDGISNPRVHAAGFASHVFVQPGDPEPPWCVGGAYLAYRKVQRRLRAFFQRSDADRERVFGVERTSGDRHANAAQAAHSSKMNPRRSGPDFTGTLDEARRFLRRPYFYDDGVDAQGQELRGLHHISFARDLVTQYEWPVVMWQTNPDFPQPGTGIDDLYRLGGASNVGGGYYFVPPNEQFIGYSLVG